MTPLVAATPGARLEHKPFGVALHLRGCTAADAARGATVTVNGRYQTVLANILATPLRVLAPLLCSHVAEGGHLVLAGILERQADELMQAYAPWVQLTVADQEDGWILMTARR